MDCNAKTGRYHRKKIHKRRLRKQHAELWLGGGSTWSDMKIRYQDDVPIQRNAMAYWRNYTLSGPRAFAKRCTNRKIRTDGRMIARCADEESAYAPQRGNYRRVFDYDWTVW